MARSAILSGTAQPVQPDLAMLANVVAGIRPRRRAPVLGQDRGLVAVDVVEVGLVAAVVVVEVVDSVVLVVVEVVVELSAAPVTVTGAARRAIG